MANAGELHAAALRIAVGFVDGGGNGNEGACSDETEATSDSGGLGYAGTSKPTLMVFPMIVVGRVSSVALMMNLYQVVCLCRLENCSDQVCLCA